MIPESIKSKIESHLEDFISSMSPLYGGDINKAVKIEMDSGDQFFLKWNPHSPEGMFEVEAKGLELLSSAGSELVIPEVYLAANDFLLMEFIEESNSGDFFEFGVQLARLHKKTNELFGLDHSNFIGRLPQSNKYHNDWLEFFVRERIEPQVKMAIDSGKISKKYATTFHRPFNYTYVVFPEEPPALVHGDLWGGNFMFTTSGKTSIYDPAVYYGHREMDIAMTQLFSGFSPEFYEGYNEEYPLKKGYQERIKLCNLYPLLVHANLFGGSYVSQSEALLNRFF
jgi:fructosamine-3-kinase